MHKTKQAFISNVLQIIIAVVLQIYPIANNVNVSISQSFNITDSFIFKYETHTTNNYYNYVESPPPK